MAAAPVKQLHVNIPERLMAEIRDAAEREHETLSQWVRRALREHARPGGCDEDYGEPWSPPVEPPGIAYTPEQTRARREAERMALDAQ